MTGRPMAWPGSMRRPQAPTRGYGAFWAGSGVDSGSLAPHCALMETGRLRSGYNGEKFLALGPVSRILFRALRRFGRHFSRALSGPPGRPPRGGAAGRRTDATYPRLLDGPPSLLFCLAPDGVFRAARLAAGRGGLLPHLFTLARRPRGAAWRSVLCDTVRHRGLTRGACACLSARAASCPVVSGLSSPNFYRARRYPRLGIKELGATTRPQS